MDPLNVAERAVQQPRARALRTPRPLTDVERIELSWSRAHPEGRVERTELALVLWNFGVDQVRVKTEHEDALRAFLAPWLISPIPAPVDISVTGYASATGAEQINAALAEGRADAVARLLGEQGFGSVTAAGAGIVADHTGVNAVGSVAPDGESLARARRVVVEVPARPGPGPEVPTAVEPESVPESRLPSWFPRGAARITVDTPEIDFRIPPVNPVLEGTLSLVGDATVVYGDPQLLNTLLGIWNAREDRLSAQLSAALTDSIVTKLQVDVPTPNRPVPGARWTAEFKDIYLKPEIGFQTSQNFIFVALNLTERTWSFEFLGGRLDVVPRLRARFNLRPGTWLLSQIGRFVARTVTVVAESAVGGAASAAVPVVVAVGVVGVALAWSAGVAAEMGYAREAGLARARLVTARVAFAAPLATVTVGTDDARAQLADLLRTLGVPRGESLVAGVATANANAAADAFAALPEPEQARTIDRWRQRYGVTSTGTPDVEFNAVRERMSLALGGVSAGGSADFQLTDL